MKNKYRLELPETKSGLAKLFAAGFFLLTAIAIGQLLWAAPQETVNDWEIPEFSPSMPSCLMLLLSLFLNLARPCSSRPTTPPGTNHLTAFGSLTGYLNRPIFQLISGCQTTMTAGGRK